MGNNNLTPAFLALQKKYIDIVFGELQCQKCIHKKHGRTCDAFAWIPGDILAGHHDHSKPYPGDKGILFEPEIKSPHTEKKS